ncbi:MAG: hypothetical protein HYT30_00315 [Parcubacteria group bacterium]|nr:hypothetical protein [Parcubacteria group bacterium]
MPILHTHVHDMLERNHISRELIALYAHRILTQAGVAVAGVFTVVFVYEYFGNSLWAVLYTYSAIQFGSALTTPLAARLLCVIGTRTTLLLSLPCMVFGAAVLYIINEHGAVGGFTPIQSIALFVIAIVLFKALYWVPYHVDISALLDRTKRGIQLALLENTADVNIAAMPFWGGLIIASLGFGSLFLFAIILISLSSLPLFWVTNRYETYSWGYAETWAQLFARRNRPILIAYVGDGIQSGAQLIVWPLFVFLLLDGEYIALGAVAALTLFSVIFLRFLTGNVLDGGGKNDALNWGAALSASGWLLRMFAATPVAIVAVDTYYGFGQVVNRISLEAISYEQAADNGRFVDEFTVLKEMSLSLGRVLSLVCAGFFAWVGGMYFGFFMSLLFAAFAALGTTWLSKKVWLR